MTVKYSLSNTFWLVPHQVILSVLGSTMNGDDMHQQNEDILKLLREGELAGVATIHLCIDASLNQRLPIPLEVIRTFSFTDDPALGLFVVGGVNNPIITFFSRFMSKMVKNRAETFLTTPLALQYLMQQDTALPDLLPLYTETMQMFGRF